MVIIIFCLLIVYIGWHDDFTALSVLWMVIIGGGYKLLLEFDSELFACTLLVSTPFLFDTVLIALLATIIWVFFAEMLSLIWCNILILSNQLFETILLLVFLN